jgi:hypothetical protein
VEKVDFSVPSPHRQAQLSRSGVPSNAAAPQFFEQNQGFWCCCGVVDGRETSIALFLLINQLVDAGVAQIPGGQGSVCWILGR